MQNLLLDPKEIDSERAGRHRGAAHAHRGRSRRVPRRGGRRARLHGASLRRSRSSAGWRTSSASRPRRFAPSTRRTTCPNNAIVVAVGDFRAPDAARADQASASGAIPRGADAAAGARRRARPERRAARRWSRRQAELPDRLPRAITCRTRRRRTRPRSRCSRRSSPAAGPRGSTGASSTSGSSRSRPAATTRAFSFDPNLFWFWATPHAGADAGDAREGAARRDGASSSREPVTDEELQRAKNQIEAAFVFQEDSVHRRASLLARFETDRRPRAQGHVPRAHPRGDRRRRAARRPRLLPRAAEERRRPPAASVTRRGLALGAAATLLVAALAAAPWAAATSAPTTASPSPAPSKAPRSTSARRSPGRIAELARARGPARRARAACWSGSPPTS